MFQSKYKNVNIKGEEYPLTSNRKMLRYCVVGMEMMFVLFFILVNFAKVEVFGFSKGIPGVTVVISYFIMQQVLSGIYNTGAFEVVCNGEIIYSKIQTGKYPRIEELEKAINRKGMKLEEIGK